MIHKLDKYLERGYSETHASDMLNRVYMDAVNNTGRVTKVVRVVSHGVTQEVRVGYIPRVRRW